MARCRLCQKTTDDGVSMIGWVENGEMVHECSECHGAGLPAFAENRTEEIINKTYAGMPATRDRMIREQRKSSAELRKRFKVDTIHKYIR